MSDQRHNQWDEQQRRAQEAVGSLGPVPADPEFRASLRERFIDGSLADGHSDGAAVVRPPAGLWRRSLVWIPVAAAAVLAFALVGLNPLPGPQILGLEGAGRVLVDGREFSAADRAGLDQALRAGSRVELGPEVTLDLIYPGSMAMRLEAGTEMTLPGRPGRWFHRSVEADLPLGELSLRTGPRLKGGQVLVSTPEGLTTVRGTLISVFRNPDVTCVCLFEGSASVAVGGQDLGRLDPQKRWVMFSDGSEPALMAIEPGHRDHMLSFDEKWRHELGLE